MTTSKTGRKPIVGGNWKSNPGSVAKIKELATTFAGANFDAATVDVAIAPTFVHLHTFSEALAAAGAGGSAVHISAQNCSREGEGAFTGEITAGMLVDVDLAAGRKINHVIVGHSERRHKYGETDEELGKKAVNALAAGDNSLTVIYCIGELLEEREGGKTQEVCETQIAALAAAIKGVEGGDEEKLWSRIVLAYEPVWAIGTGKVASVEQAQEAHAWCRDILKAKVNENVAAATRIQYGGSVSADNCGALIKCPDVDGFLVGGASLKPAFVDIVKAVEGEYKA